MSHEEELLTTAELAARLKLAAETVRAWAAAGKVPAVKVGRKAWRLRLSEVLKALEAGQK
jgi:excisionase family DNA binding protein